MLTYAIAPNPVDSDAFVELSAPKGSKFRVFEKHILNMGTFHYNGRIVQIDDDFYNKMVSNFERGVGGPVSVPKTDDRNQHNDALDNNVGQVVGLSRRGGKIYARFEARDEMAADKFGKIYLGASAFFHMNYPLQDTGERVGPTLLHVAVTNRPHLSSLDSYQEVFLSRVDDSMDEAVVLTAANKENEPMTLDEMLTTLKVDHDIDVPELQERAKQGDKAIALTAQISQTLVDNDLIELSSTDDLNFEAIEKAIVDARGEIVSLSAQVEEMNTAQARAEAEAKVQKLVDDAFITEEKAEAYIKLSMSDPEAFEAIIPEEAFVRLSAETGTEEDSTPPEVSDEDKVQADIDRITSYEGFDWKS